MKKLTGIIPSQYWDEFIREQTGLIKNRVRLFCVLALFIYFLGVIITFSLYPREFNAAEIPLWIVLIASSIAILIFNSRVQTLKLAKLSAYIFTIILLTFLTLVSLVYFKYIEVSTPLYLFMLFLVAFTIPWHPWEIIPITLLHMIAYTILFALAQCFIVPRFNIVLSREPYIDGILFLAMAFILCIVIRRKDAVREAENFTLLKEVERKNEVAQGELELATRVHKTLIPHSVSSDLLDVAVLYLPIYYIGGDYAKFHFIDDRRLNFIICDVTGHGVPAALLVNRIHAEFERLAREGKEPGALLQQLNRFIIRDFEGTNMYMSAFCGLLDFDRQKLLYSNHGHPDQYIYRITKGSIENMGSLGGLLGIPLDTEVHQHDVDFSKGDRILLFTDGVLETRNREGKEFGRERLETFIKNNSRAEVNLFNQKLLDELHGFKHRDFGDDIFLVTIHIK